MVTILDKTFGPFLSQDDIERRIGEMAAQINEDYHGKTPIFIVVLNGAFLFASELLKRLDLSCEVSFVRLASYEHLASTGTVREIMGLQEDIKDRDVVVIEDIVDTGLTMHQLLQQLQSKQPSSLVVATLLHKPEALVAPVTLQYAGFEIENKFVVGYGLDYDGLGRNLNAIYVLQQPS
ncbi:hypoxanthine phosphoribosyltransferase [Dyadobacter jejuensis]|uniref:Hypoxanthine phosphoribosyltransferase n=1 Tax=Dyadobacter jejuensis TaxID=1082580 RepID=A0A316ASX5_9BACT|nr:hypoxanthine phosphoribosyltransferase [Dyadobacter jejuensis]PWJ59920.1 hypoxanthine phosphoribosyltransferase [Dyadobacter jejuensis]